MLDGTIGQAAELQARAFSESVNVGSIIITKMDGHAKGGGAISAVAATHSPIIFIGTGEHAHDFESFNAKSFVSRMLNMGDFHGLMEKVQDMPMSGEFMKDSMNLLRSGGNFTIKDFQKQLNQLGQLGPLDKLMGMIPGMGAQQMSAGQQEDTQKNMRKILRMMDSMTAEELAGDFRLFQ